MTTELRDPQPGDWLVADDDSSMIVYLVGKNASGEWVIEWNDGNTSIDGPSLDDWHREPVCTGFDWKPAPSKTPMPITLWTSSRIMFEPGDWPVRASNNGPPSGPGSWVKIRYDDFKFHCYAEE